MSCVYVPKPGGERKKGEREGEGEKREKEEGEDVREKKKE